jgi:hypothetical protein
MPVASLQASQSQVCWLDRNSQFCQLKNRHAAQFCFISAIFANKHHDDKAREIEDDDSVEEVRERQPKHNLVSSYYEPS